MNFDVKVDSIADMTWSKGNLSGSYKNFNVKVSSITDSFVKIIFKQKSI